METKQLIINPAVLLKVAVNDPYKVELVDSLVVTPIIREKALTPFINSLMEGLIQTGKDQDSMIPRYALNEVKYIGY